MFETQNLTQWLWTGGVFVAALFILLTVKKVLWNNFEKWAAGTSTSWDDLLLQRIHAPVTALFGVAAIGIAGQAAPEAVRHHTASIMGIKIALIAIAMWMIDRLVCILFEASTSSHKYGKGKGVLLGVLRFILLSLGILIVLDTLGISITPLLASLGVGSVAVALAAQDTLSNLFSGLYIFADEPVRLGDFIRLETGVEGTVEKIGWRSTRLKMLNNNMVIVPNSKVASAQITNFDAPDKEMAVLVAVGVSYNSDLSRVENITCEVARQILRDVPAGVAGFEPFIRYSAFGESSIDFNVILRAKSFTDQYLLKHEFIKALHRRYQQEGIEIPFPQRVVHSVGKNT